MLSEPGERVIRRFVLASTCVCASVPSSAASPELANELAGVRWFFTPAAPVTSSRTHVNILHQEVTTNVLCHAITMIVFFLHIYS